MKKRILVIILAIVMVFTAVSFTGCKTSNETCQITVIIGDNTYNLETDCRTLHEVLQQLYADGTIAAYDYSGTEFSPYVTKVDTVADTYAVDAHYIAIFHNIDEMALQTFSSVDYKPITIEHNGITFYYSYVGVALLPVVDGAVYYIFATTEFYY